MKRGGLSGALLTGAITFAIADESRELTLADGKRYTVKLIDATPTKFRNSKVRFLSGTLILDNREKPAACLWRVKFQLMKKAVYSITVRSPLEPSFEEILGGEGPGEVEHELRGTSRSDRFCRWREGGDTSYVPLDITFRDRKSGSEFSFRQWLWIDPWARSFFKSLEELKDADSRSDPSGGERPD